MAKKEKTRPADAFLERAEREIDRLDREARQRRINAMAEQLCGQAEREKKRQQQEKADRERNPNQCACGSIKTKIELILATSYPAELALRQRLVVAVGRCLGCGAERRGPARHASKSEFAPVALRFPALLSDDERQMYKELLSAQPVQEST